LPALLEISATKRRSMTTQSNLVKPVRKTKKYKKKLKDTEIEEEHDDENEQRHGHKMGN
jgi:hypothetical protein